MYQRSPEGLVVAAKALGTNGLTSGMNGLLEDPGLTLRATCWLSVIAHSSYSLLVAVREYEYSTL
jgi:hypothetical protein